MHAISAVLHPMLQRLQVCLLIWGASDEDACSQPPSPLLGFAVSVDRRNGRDRTVCPLGAGCLDSDVDHNKQPSLQIFSSLCFYVP